MGQNDEQLDFTSAPAQLPPAEDSEAILGVGTLAEVIGMDAAREFFEERRARMIFLYTRAAKGGVQVEMGILADNHAKPKTLTPVAPTLSYKIHP